MCNFFFQKDVAFLNMIIKYMVIKDVQFQVFHGLSPAACVPVCTLISEREDLRKMCKSVKVWAAPYAGGIRLQDLRLYTVESPQRPRQNP